MHKHSLDYWVCVQSFALKKFQILQKAKKNLLFHKKIILHNGISTLPTSFNIDLKKLKNIKRFER